MHVKVSIIVDNVSVFSINESIFSDNESVFAKNVSIIATLKHKNYRFMYVFVVNESINDENKAFTGGSTPAILVS